MEHTGNESEQATLLGVATAARSDNRAKRDQEKSERLKRNEERDSRVVKHLEIAKKTILDAIEEHTKKGGSGKALEAAGKGWSSVPIARFYVRATTTNTLPNGDRVQELAVPFDKTVLVGPGESEREGTAWSFLLRGAHDRVTRTNDPSRIAGGLTVLDIVNKELSKNEEPYPPNCTVRLEVKHDQEYRVESRTHHGMGNATCFDVVLIWDVPGYEKRLARLLENSAQNRANRLANDHWAERGATRERNQDKLSEGMEEARRMARERARDWQERSSDSSN